MLNYSSLSIQPGIEQKAQVYSLCILKRNNESMGHLVLCSPMRTLLCRAAEQFNPANDPARISPPSSRIMKIQDEVGTWT
jgi:hypothetical protein